ncbi:hypothetical protein VMUT_2210 [Vulcanisaeta moutnovskia 768-28]|uniref:Uncharacterized protein n=1 Tax=Vulcanisaeta moutnovskia (strain 768-28) TaxID=985053 RepID=F0QXJ1_VULM7|nr:hypothetical protein [Vulcanisaeta moutnovskia]ADY02406.1 hypothetical protein VMUT_2210 [Vulcanisaeta moutnovskia 768-28]
MGIFRKEFTYNKQVNLNDVVQKFSSYLVNDGWRVQQKVEGSRALVQAQKGGILRDLIAADRALTFTFEQFSDKLRVTVGVGKWLQNLAVTALETLFLGELFLAVDVAEMLWNEHVEKTLVKKLEEIIQTS